MRSSRDSCAGIAGQTAQNRIIKMLNSKNKLSSIISFNPLRVFPFGRLYYRGKPRNKLYNSKVIDVSYINIPLLKQFTLNVMIAFHLLRTAKRNDIIVSYNVNTPSLLPLLLLKRVKGVKVFSFVYDIDIPGRTVSRWSIFHHVTIILMKFGLRRLTGVIGITDDIRTDFNIKSQRFLHSEGVVDNIINNEYRAIGNNRPLLIGFAGSLTATNGVPLLLDFINSYNSSKFEFVIMGDGPLKKKIAAVSKKLTNINFLGLVEKHKSDEILMQCDLLLNLRLDSSRISPYLFPSKFLEFHSISKPVVSTYLSLSGEENFADFNFVVEHHNAESLKTAIERFLNSDYGTLKRMYAARTRYISRLLDINAAQSLHQFFIHSD